MTNLTQFKQFNSSEGIEILIDAITGEAGCSINGYSRLSGKAKSTISERLDRMSQGVRETMVKELEIQTAGGLQGVRLISEDLIAEWIIDDNPAIAKKLLKAGVRVFLHTQAGYEVKSTAVESQPEPLLLEPSKLKIKELTIDIQTKLEVAYDALARLEQLPPDYLSYRELELKEFLKDFKKTFKRKRLQADIPTMIAEIVLENSQFRNDYMAVDLSELQPIYGELLAVYNYCKSRPRDTSPLHLYQHSRYNPLAFGHVIGIKQVVEYFIELDRLGYGALDRIPGSDYPGITMYPIKQQSIKPVRIDLASNNIGDIKELDGLLLDVLNFTQKKGGICSARMLCVSSTFYRRKINGTKINSESATELLEQVADAGYGEMTILFGNRVASLVLHPVDGGSIRTIQHLRDSVIGN